jgi:CspA family cold shock protein
VPPEPIGTEDAGTGVVKWWRDNKGYGVIACDKTSPWDIWCHFSHIEGAGFRSLTAGERVVVDYVRLDRESFKYVARRVRQRLLATRQDDATRWPVA